MELSAEEAKSAKVKLNNCFFDYFKKVVLKQIEISGEKFLLGSFPYWEDESKFATQVSNEYQLIINSIEGEKGEGIEGQVTFTLDIIKNIFEKYEIPLLFKFSAATRFNEDYITIENDEDFKKIIKFSILYYNFHEQEQVDNANELIEKFYLIMFLNQSVKSLTN